MFHAEIDHLSWIMHSICLLWFRVVAARSCTRSPGSTVSVVLDQLLDPSALSQPRSPRLPSAWPRPTARRSARCWTRTQRSCTSPSSRAARRCCTWRARPTACRSSRRCSRTARPGTPSTKVRTAPLCRCLASLCAWVGPVQCACECRWRDLAPLTLKLFSIEIVRLV